MDKQKARISYGADGSLYEQKKKHTNLCNYECLADRPTDQERLILDAQSPSLYSKIIK